MNILFPLDPSNFGDWFGQTLAALCWMFGLIFATVTIVAMVGSALLMTAYYISELFRKKDAK